MSKVAILNIRNIKDSAGGPSGYLYNLYKGFEHLDRPEIPDFIYMVDENNNLTGNKPLKAGLKSRFPGLRYLLYFIKQGFYFKIRFKNEIIKYSVIHVHTSEAVIYLKLFCKYTGKIIFTPHRPETIKNEMLSKFNNTKSGKYLVTGKLLDRIEALSYRYSDAFIFPCEDAKKIYKNYPGFIKYEGKKTEYVYTGIQKKRINIQKNEYRKSHGIDKCAYVIGYIGRHNKIKGYDRLVSIYPQLEKLDINVLVAGGNDGIDFPISDYWHELGYINDVQNFMNAVDVIVVPNRNTYFDLVIIEALSHGKIVITSNTGGNISIAKETTAMLLFDNSIKSLLDVIVDVKNMSREEREVREKNGLQFYEEKCSCEAFAWGYLSALDRIIHTF